MLNAAAVACIEQVRLGFVASVTSGGRPSVSPKGTFVVLDERKIAFAEIHCRFGNNKLSIICINSTQNIVVKNAFKHNKFQGRCLGII